MSYIDIIISLILVYSFVNGFIKGAIKEIIEIAALLSAVYFSTGIYNFLFTRIEILKETPPLVGIGLVVVLIIIASKLLVPLFNKAAKTLHLDGLNKFIGSIVSFLKWFVIVSFVTVVLENFNIVPKETKKESAFYNKILDYKITHKLKENMPTVKGIPVEIEEKIKTSIEEKIIEEKNIEEKIN